jgi:hypothetical protein
MAASAIPQFVAVKIFRRGRPNGAGATSTVVIDGEGLERRTQQQSATAVLIEAGAPFDAAAIYTNF